MFSTFDVKMVNVVENAECFWWWPVVTEPQTMGEMAIFNPLLILAKISVYIWDELRATNGNLYDKTGS